MKAALEDLRRYRQERIEHYASMKPKNIGDVIGSLKSAGPVQPRRLESTKNLPLFSTQLYWAEVDSSVASPKSIANVWQVSVSDIVPAILSDPSSYRSVTEVLNYLGKQAGALGELSDRQKKSVGFEIEEIKEEEIIQVNIGLDDNGTVIL